MANWELLDKAFYSTIDSMSNEDWDNWHKNQDKRQSMRQEKMQNDWVSHLIKLSTNDDKGNFFYSSKVSNPVFFNKNIKPIKIVASPQLAFIFCKKSLQSVLTH